MKPIDNINEILPFLEFKEKGDFYHLIVMKRKADQATDKANHQSVRTIKTYTIESQQYLLERYDEVKELCENFKARAYINMNRLNNKEVALKMIEKLVHHLQNNNPNVKGVYDSVVGSLASKEKRWVIDIDNVKLLDVVKGIIAGCQPHHTDKILLQIPSKKGIHLITKAFRKDTFSEMLKNMEITEDEVFIQPMNPTNLYIPLSIMKDVNK